MDTQALKFFISAAMHLNFTKAAKECFITQTAMSLRMSKLEEELGFLLFYREHRRLSLTPAGQVFLKDAIRIVSEYDMAVKQAYNASLGYESTLRIGFSNYLERISLPSLIPIFQKENPNVKIFVAQDKQWILREKLKQGQLDIILVSSYDVIDDPEIQIDVSYKYPLVVLLAKDHPFAKEKVMTCEMIRKVNSYIVDAEEMPNLYGFMLEDWSKAGIHPKEIISVDSADTILLSVEAGLGMAILPDLMKQLDNGQFAFLELEVDQGDFVISFAHCVNDRNPALPRFLDILKKQPLV